MSDVPRPDVRSLVAALTTDADEIHRRRLNQVAIENAGHVQSIPMTSQGLAKLQMLRDTMLREMQERGIPLSVRGDVLRGDPVLSLQGKSTRLELVTVQPIVCQALANREAAKSRECMQGPQP